LLNSQVWISQGATVGVPITARVLSNGSPRSNFQVKFSIVLGSGTLSAGSAQTNSGGYASVTLNVNQVSAALRVSACVAPSNAPCRLFYANVVPLAQQVLLPVSGGGQISTGQAFQPVIVRITDSSTPPNPVMAAPINFLMTVLREAENTGNDGRNPMPVILKVSQTGTTTDFNGFANIVPSASGFSAPVEVDVYVTAGVSAALDYPLQVLQAPSKQNSPPQTKAPPQGQHRLRVARAPWEIR
jgi:hypothetical protein